MKWKKMISILLAAVLCVSVLAGCGDGDLQSQADKVAKELNSKMNSNIKLEFVEKNAYDSSLEELDGYFYTDKEQNLCLVVIFDKYTEEFAGVLLSKGDATSDTDSFEIGKEKLSELKVFDFSKEEKAAYQKGINSNISADSLGDKERNFDIGERFHAVNLSYNNNKREYIRIHAMGYDVW